MALSPMNVAVVFTSSVLGGHEIMAVRLGRQWTAQGDDVSFYVPEQNPQLMDFLVSQGLAFKKHPMNPVALGSVQALLNPWLIGKAVRTIKLIKKESNFAKFIVVQGDIEFGAVFLLASRLLGVEPISYLPYAHSFKKMGAKLSWIRDLFAKVIYRCCTNYITISPFFADQLRLLNPSSNIQIITNFLPDTVGQGPSRAVRPPGPIRLFVVGRVYFRQKGQDLLIDALSRLTPGAERLEVHFIGDGPDMERLRQLAATLPEWVKPAIHGWCEEWWSLGKGPDVLVIPSRFEGVPLVMLEAIRQRIPVIAPKRDGMADYLPLEHLYKACESRGQEVEHLRLKLQEVISSPHNFLKG